MQLVPLVPATLVAMDRAKSPFSLEDGLASPTATTSTTRRSTSGDGDGADAGAGAGVDGGIAADMDGVTPPHNENKARLIRGILVSPKASTSACSRYNSSFQ